MDFRMEVQGLDTTVQNLQTFGMQISGAQMIGAVQQGTTLLQSEARINLVGWQSPTTGGRDTGTLSNSLTAEVSKESDKVVGKMGSALEYSPFVEHNTGAHFPPPDKISPWADSHKVPLGVVLQAIRRRGTYGKKYLQKTVEEKESQAFEIIQNFIRGLAQRHG